MLLTELPRGDLVPLFKGADQMTAVRKAGLGCNIVQVIVGKKKQVFNLVQADKLDILLTALPVMLQKKFGKIGVAHVVFMCQCLDIDVFLGMAVEIDEDILHTLFLTLGNRFGIETDSLAVPRPQKAQEQCRKQRINIRVVAVLFRMGFFFNGCEKIVQVEPRKIRLRKEQGRMCHGGNLMECIAQVRMIACGKMNPVEIEFF